MARKLTWTEKLHDAKGLPKVGPIEGKMTRRWGEGTMLIPSPLEVDALMRQVGKGELTTIAHIREALAKRHKADICCPLTTGIFAWIASHAAEEQAATGKPRTTPYWRTLKAGGCLNPKYPGGVDAQTSRLKAEGHQIVPATGKAPPRVRDWEAKLSPLG